MNKVPVVAQEFVDNWSDSTWLTDERIQALRPEDLKRSDHASFVVAAGNNWGFSTGGPGDSVYGREVTLFNKVVSAYGRKFHLSDRWREYERFMKKERPTKNADQISHELKGLASRWLREEKKERESRC